MAKTAKQTLWITAVRPKEIDGQTSIPTAISYNSDSTVNIGKAALSGFSDGHIVNLEFKINVGDVNPGAVGGRQQFDTGTGKKTAYELCRDFVTAVLSKIEDETHRRDDGTGKIAAKIMVAEPLSFQVEGRSKNWLANYRENLRRMLSRYEEIDFLPEPFAVYQYYRYGLRVPRLLDRTKQIALILDFGGGTFDACVIESTKDGDVSIRGKHSKPLAAKSVPHGGFYVNRRIALYLAKRNAEGVNRKKIDQYFEQYERVKRGELDRETLRDECQHFMLNFEKLEHLVENCKLDLVSRIVSWRLDEEAYEKASVSCPKNALELGAWVETEFVGHQFRKLFVHEIWKAKLQGVIRTVLKTAARTLDGRSITTTLISGGSSNIRWLETLVSTDFSDPLAQAQPVPIGHSFQEVVANGLAIECARRFYSEDELEESEFVAVTYNPVKLHLGADGGEIVKDCKFRSINDRVDMADAKPGDLVPSAQSLRHFFDEHLQWRVKLQSPPRQFLDYYFCRDEAGLQTESTEDLLDGAFNVEEKRIWTSRNKFDRSIVVDLEVRSDGTTTPKFIYQQQNKRGGISENAEIGRPFYVDMTTASEKIGARRSNFVGFDLGTSNTAICTLSETEIQRNKDRENSGSWTNIHDSLPDLPYPVAIAVRRYLSRQDNVVTSARDAFEAGLAFMAYVAAAEACLRGRIGKLLKNFPHRAMAPLWDLFERSVRSLGDQAVYSRRLGRILEDQWEVDRFQQAIEDFTKNKHGKLADDARDWHEYVQLPARSLARGLEGLVFGRATQSEKIPFAEGKHKGVFVVAHDNQPFVKRTRYESGQSIDASLALLVSSESREAISLSPFVFWFEQNAAGSDDCYYLDRFSSRQNGPTVKPCDRDEERFAADISSGLREMIERLVQEDGRGGAEIAIGLTEVD